MLRGGGAGFLPLAGVPEPAPHGEPFGTGGGSCPQRHSGSFSDVLVMSEQTRLEPGVLVLKFHALGIGQIKESVPKVRTRRSASFR